MARQIALLVAMVSATLVVAQQSPLVIRQSFDDPGAPSLSLADAMEIVRGNQTVLQSLRDRECRSISLPDCGADLPVRARKALDTYDQRANETLIQLANRIRQAATEGPVASVVFESAGLPYRYEPRAGLQAVRDALREIGSTLSIRDMGSLGAGKRGLARLIEITGAKPYQAEVAGPATTEKAQPARPLPPVVVAAMRHAAVFAAQAATLLADEHYVQEVKTRPSSASLASMSRTSTAGITIEKRVLDSEVALIHVVDGELWLLARDIQRVNGKPLPDGQRIPLPALHPTSTPDALKKFQEIAAQGARFNIGAIERNLNVPTLALWLLTPAIGQRLAFVAAEHDTVNGKQCDVIGFREVGEPYLFVADGQPKPVSGRFWIDRAQSAVVKTELILEGRSSARSTTRAQVTVSYALDLALQAWVPMSMIERYDGDTTPGFVTGTSTYSNYRQFSVSTRIVK